MQRLTRRGGILLALWASPLSALHLAAQVGVAVRASTLGAGAELSYRLSRNFGVRVGGNYLQFSRDFTISSIAYQVTPHFENGTALLDVYPIGGSFHLSGGMLLNRNAGRLVARLSQNLQIGNQTYTPDEVGSLAGTVSFRKTAPYAGLGFAGRGRIALLLDLGVGMTGTPRVDLVGTTPLTGAAKTEFDANVARELADVRAKVDGQSYFRFHPVFSLGLRIQP